MRERRRRPRTRLILKFFPATMVVAICLCGATAAQQLEPPAMPATGDKSIPTTAPVPATTGTPGIFTVETAEGLGKGVYAVSAYGNKFGLVPGSATMLAGGLTVAAGL